MPEHIQPSLGSLERPAFHTGMSEAPTSNEILRSRNIVQARAMQKMLGLEDSAAREVTPESMQRMVTWGSAYQAVFRDLFDTDSDFRAKVLARDIDEVVRRLEAAKQKDSPAH